MGYARESYNRLTSTNTSSVSDAAGDLPYVITDILGIYTDIEGVISIPDGWIGTILGPTEWLNEIHLDFRFPDTVPSTGDLHVTWGENIASDDLDGFGYAFSSSRIASTHFTGTAASPSYSIASPTADYTLSGSTRLNVGEWIRANMILDPDTISALRTAAWVNTERGRLSVPEKAFSTSTQVIQTVTSDAAPAPSFAVLIANETGRRVELRNFEFKQWPFRAV